MLSPDQQVVPEICDAAYRGNVDRVRELLLVNTSVIFNTDASGKTALHYAALAGHESMVNLLLQLDTNSVSTRDNQGYTPLFAACFACPEEEWHLEIDKSAEPNPGCEQVIRLLVSQGADLSQRTNNGFGIMHCIALHSDNQRTRSVVKTLASLGADLNLVDDDAWTPLHVAVDSQNLEALQALIDAGADIDLRENEAGATPLHLAAVRGQAAACRILLDGGADVARVENQNLTPLHHAVYHSYEDVARILVDHGAKASPCEGVEPLYLQMPILKRELEILKLVLVAGADPGTVYGGNTGFDTAINTHQTAMVRLFIEHGVGKDVMGRRNPNTDTGLTPLHQAVGFKDYDIVDALLDAGVDPAIKDSNGRTPLDIARKRGHVLLVKKLYNLAPDM